jgi:hypothetical protein
LSGCDERGHAALGLRLGDDLESQGGLARRLGPVNLDDAAARHAADAERIVDADGPGRDARDDGDGVLLTEPHDRALAELLLDLAHGHFDCARTFLVVVCHAASPKNRPCSDRPRPR